MQSRSFQARAIALALVCAFSFAETQAVVHGPELPDPGDTGVTKQQQEQLGLQAAGEVYKQMPVLPDSDPMTQYVQRLGARLARVIPQQYTWPYQFHVIPQKEINAFALPGGPIFVNVGTIQAADNEAELAGVMAHEMSHVYMQHSIKQMKKQQMTQGLAGILGAVLGRAGGVAGALGQLGVGLGAGVLSMRYSRADEAQADAVGAIIMWKAGYDPRYLAQFFEKLASQGGSGPQFLSDHPNPGNRTQAINNEVAEWPAKQFQNNTSEFARARQEAMDTRVYTAQQISQGAKDGSWYRMNQQGNSIPRNVNVSGPAPGAPGGGSGGSISNVAYSQIRPSRSFTTTSNNVFSIAYPDNWRVFNEQSGMTIAPPAGVAEGAVAYGVIINTARDPNAYSLDDATRDLAQQLEQANPGLRAAGRPQPVRINGVEARSVDMIGTSPLQSNGRPVPERDWLVILQGRGSGELLYLVFVAPEQDFDQLRPTYEAMLRKLHVQ
ncbi:MAG: M48 family metalloprotease [Acidobacteria bacterium]|nr:M48 family metalloprotease [Acidobacteriota bacterium]